MMLRSNLGRKSSLLAALVFCLITRLCCQNVASSITGKVTDRDGGTIADALVLVIDEATATTVQLRTNADGIYSAEGLSVGEFTVTISAPGFQTSTTQHIHLDPGERRSNNISLAIGSQAETVNVNANVQSVNTESSENGGTVNEKQVENLMLNGRDFMTLALAVPGVTSVGGTDQQSLANSVNVNIVVNGAGAETSVQTIDGIYNMNSGDMNQIALKPIVDGISEFTVLKDNYSAKYGFASSAQILVATKAGSSQLHGSAWEYVRNNDFDAKNYFSTITPPLHQNIFGYSIGGPIRIPKIYPQSNKTFFFASNQWFRVNSGVTLIGAVMPEALRNGDFTNSQSRTGDLTLDAHSEALLASQGKTGCLLSANVLNPACFDPVAAALLKSVIPLPNNAANGFANYLNQASSPSSENDYQYRVDHHISDNEVITGRVNYMSQPQIFVGTFSTLDSQQKYGAFNAFLRLQSTIRPTLINTFTMAESRFRVLYDVLNDGTLPSGVSIAQAFPNAPTRNHIPTIGIYGGYTGIGVTFLPFTATDGEGILQDDLNWVRGRHVFSTGAIYMFGIKRQNVFTIPEGSFSFTGAHTGDPAADFLLGLDSSYSQASSRRDGYFHYRQGEAYVQDDWKPTTRLTLNLGVRWQYFSNDTVSGDQVTGFDAKKYIADQAPAVNLDGSLTVDAQNNPLTRDGSVANLLNGIVFAGRDGVPDGFFVPRKTNFSPRIGFAYDVLGNSKYSIRGGYGMGYSRIPLEELWDAFGQNPPYNLSANILNSLLSNATAGGIAAAPTTQVLKIPPLSFTPTQVQSYSLSVEHQVVNNMIATIAYAGSQTRHILTVSDSGGFDLNFPLPVTAPSASGCLAAGQSQASSYDFDPCINTFAASPDYTRPFQGYNAIYYQYQGGTGNYNSFQSGLSYRGNPLQFTVAYTYSKALTTVGGRTAGTFSAAWQAPQNPRDPHAEYGPPAYDFTHDISGTWTYNLPKLGHAAKLVEWALGDWSFSGLALHQSGYALSPGLAIGTLGLAARPNLIAHYKKVGSPTEWFDTSVFAAPAYGFFGNSRNGMIRGPGYTSTSLSLKKAFPIVRESQFQLSAEAFNILNHPNFENVDANLGSGTFGQAIAAGDPRIMEFAARIVF